MLTTNYSPRSPFKRLMLWVSLAILALGTLLSCQINRWVPGYAHYFANSISEQFQVQISFDGIHYRFPDHLIFKHVRVLEADGRHMMLQADRVVMGFSLPLFSQPLMLDSMVADGLIVDEANGEHYWAGHGGKIAGWARRQPRGRMHVLVPDGRLRLPGEIGNGLLPFNFDLQRKGEKFQLQWQAQKATAHLWGTWESTAVDWRGFIFYDKFYILDINGQSHRSARRFELQQSFSINGRPVRISGYCTEGQCDARINFNDIHFWFHGLRSMGGLDLDGSVDSPLGHLDFNNFRPQMVKPGLARIQLGQIQGAFLFQGHRPHLLLKNISADLHLGTPYRKTILLTADLYGGQAETKLTVDTSTLPWKLQGQGSLHDMDISQIDEGALALSQSRGRLNSRFNIRSIHPLELSGHLDIKGDFMDSRIQNQIASFLQMPSLNRMPQAQISCDFHLQGRANECEDLKLNSEDVDLHGYFNTDAHELVSSRMAVRFSQKLIQESPAGRRLVKLVREGAWMLPFEIRLSGNMHRMNFQWENSSLKQKVKRHIIPFIQRVIDRRMDQPSYKAATPNESLSPG